MDKLDRVPRMTWKFWGLGLFAPALLLTGGPWAYWRFVDHGFRTIAPGAVYQSAEMPPEALLRTVERYGIHTVLDLREEPQDKLDEERAVLDAAGVRYVNLPTPQVPADATVATFLDLIQEPDSLPVLIHCEHGEGRSVLFAALYRIEFEGWEPEVARQATRLFAWRGSFKPGASKGEYLRNYERRLPVSDDATH